MIRPAPVITTDDEGYTSPYEEEFRYNSNPFVPTSGILPVVPPTTSQQPFHSLSRNPFGASLNDLNESPSIRHIRNPPSNQDEDKERIPWDEISKLPYIPNRHLTWDDLQVPIPFRYDPAHVRLARKGLESPNQIPFLLDSIEKSSQLVDIIWRVIPNSEVKSENPKSPVRNLKECLQKPNYISLKQFIQHLMHLLSGRESLSFLINDSSHEEGGFEKNPAILINGISPTALYNYCEPLIRCGSIVKRLNIYAALQFDNSLIKAKGIEQNAVMMAFLRFISDYLKLYQTILMLNSPNISSLTGLLKFISPFRHQLETLEWILKNNLSGNAVELLSSLNYLLFCDETPFISDLIRGLFITCASAYLKHVSDWIFRGNLGPPSEFHIDKPREIPYRDRRFWTKQFSHTNEVPMFLEESVELIFETGKAINLLNQIQDENIFASIPLFCYDTDVLLTPALEFNQVNKLQTVWDKKLNDFLEEQSYLIQDISSSINQLLTSKNQEIDNETVEEAKIDQQKKLLTARLDEVERQNAKKKEFREILEEQIEQSKAKKLQNIENSRLEDQKNEDYITMRDKRNSVEEKRIRMKHFGDENVKKQKNDLFSRLHSAPAEMTTRNITETVVDGFDIFSASEAHNVDTKVIEFKSGSGDQQEFVEDLDHNYKTNVKLESDDGTAIKGSNKMDQSNASVEDADVIDSNEELVEERFNPNKIKTKNPPPYRTCVSLESSRLVSFLEMSQTKEDEDLNADSEAIQTRYDSYCISQFLSQSILIPLYAQNRMVNAAVLHYFICEKKLFYHLEALNNFLCLQNGSFGHSLSNLLIQEINRKNLRSKEDIIKKSGRLNMILAEAISVSVENEEENPFIRNLAFTINKDFVEETKKSKSVINEKQKSTVSSEFEILDTVRLCYSVDWPLNIILTEDVLHNYERLFVFLMQLFRAELLLQRAFFVLKFKSCKSHQLFTLHHYRYRLLHFVRTVRNYVNVTVIHSSWNELCSSFSKMNSLEKLYEHIVRHIKSLNTNCLLGVKAEGVMKLLKNQLVIIETFCGQLEQVASTIDWSKGEEIPAKDFKKLVQKFKAVEEIGKVFTVVAYKLVNRGYYPKVSYFLELYNFNGFFQMKSVK